MPLGRLRIRSVRCLDDVEVDLECGPAYFFGPNGAGKTSLLESIHLLSRGRSFRTRDTRKLIAHGATGLTVFGEVWVGGARHRLGIAFEGGRLEKRRDGTIATGMPELAALLPVHVVDPSSHQLVEGGPSDRRRFLDWGVFHVEHGYLDAWRRYRRVLGQRNAALKRDATDVELGTWTEALADAGDAVDGFRRRYVERLQPVAARLGRALLGDPLEIDYRRGWSREVSLADALRTSARQDRALGHTQPGPHRADLTLRLGGAAVRDHASRGQQKLAAAALVLAQAAVQADAEPGEPVLLVDDPAAELDPTSLARLREALGTIPAQRIVTGLSPAQLPPEPDAHMFHVEQGRVRPG